MTDNTLRSPARGIAEAAALMLLDIHSAKRMDAVEKIARAYDKALAERWPDREEQRKKFILLLLLEIAEVCQAMGYTPAGTVGTA